ncbi:efflux RND transporter periplasmic adaptor subunit [Hydrotalea sandarakina]|jgi:Cu(I)/Ag(I) efflux system membrane fusion protein|uniref:Cu(I)/Ag(I) efflux system membrane fusion protein n=1 Tax=Hydrotalea sandarakina TaxID=1004304 RepID=A0A2W7SN84_9BACT|nr:efflux RND transporter periplasmic adaptor subunit [Hydrotalea sandarakina]PZX64425.1 Cu(I)/Ag(I) efflux system membrane fusion protein [Hydrotalea sandarakina]
MKKLTIFIYAILFLISACKQKQNSSNTASSNVYYTCSMHPQVKQDKPGTCPICHMELIAVDKQMHHDNAIHLTNEQLELGNIQSDTVQQGTIANEMILTATVTYNPTGLQTVTARINGRIDKLYIRQTGVPVQKGMPLYDLYSEELNNAKQSYVQLYQQQKAHPSAQLAQLVNNAKNKLLLWGMSENAVAQLPLLKNIPLTTTFYSSVSGVITELPIVEGQYVNEGAPLFNIADLSTVYVDAQVYAVNELSIHQNDWVEIQLPQFPTVTMQGKVIAINPFLSDEQHIVLVRIMLDNKTQLLKPGMPAYVISNIQKQQGWVLPLQAVLQLGNNKNVVWVRTSEHTFEQRMVQIGTQNKNNIVVVNGLKKGDVVVTHGAYLLNSEAVFKNGSEMQMNMPGMKM